MGIRCSGAAVRRHPSVKGSSWNLNDFVLLAEWIQLSEHSRGDCAGKPHARGVELLFEDRIWKMVAWLSMVKESSM